MDFCLPLMHFTACSFYDSTFQVRTSNWDYLLLLLLLLFILKTIVLAKALSGIDGCMIKMRTKRLIGIKNDCNND